MKLVRSQCTEAIDTLLQDGEIKNGALLGQDMSGAMIESLVVDVRNVLLIARNDDAAQPDGAIFFHWQEPGVYEVHTMALPAIRGAEFISAVRDALQMMFLASDAMELYTRVPEGNGGALGLVRAIHGRREFTTQSVTFYALHFSEWLWKSFATDKPDSVRMLSAASELILNGMTIKALILYNRWAKLAGRSPMSVALSNPLVLSVDGALLQVDYVGRTLIPIELDEPKIESEIKKVA